VSRRELCVGGVHGATYSDAAVLFYFHFWQAVLTARQALYVLVEGRRQFQDRDGYQYGSKTKDRAGEVGMQVTHAACPTVCRLSA
jgi:hypothetical protein